jgi:hypothetical protein
MLGVVDELEFYLPLLISGSDAEWEYYEGLCSRGTGEGSGDGRRCRSISHDAGTCA